MKADTQVDVYSPPSKNEVEHLWKQEQASLRGELAAYAAEGAGTLDDLDPGWKAMGLESLWDAKSSC